MPAPSPERDRGFTLVELLIVIVILGILATVTVFAVRGLTTQAKAQSCATERADLNVAVEAYLAAKSVNAIPINATETATVGSTAARTLKLTGYIKDVSTLYDVAVDGTLTAVPNNLSACT